MEINPRPSQTIAMRTDCEVDSIDELCRPDRNSSQNRRGDTLPVVRSDVPLAPGNSGGPLVNAYGEVVGINAMIVGGDQSVSIAVSVANDFVNNVFANEGTGGRPNGRTPDDVI